MTLPIKALDRLAFRFRELVFDVRNGVDTRGHLQLAGQRITGPHLAQATYYGAADDKVLSRTLSGLPIAYEQFTFVDFGAGKGKGLLVAARYPFRAVVGVEFSGVLVDAANWNLTHWKGASRAGSVDMLLMDATEYEYPLEPLVVFMYNPFGAEIVARVVQRMLESLARHPRPFYIAYANALHRSVIDATDAFTVIDDSRYCLVYEWTGAPPRH